MPRESMHSRASRTANACISCRQSKIKCSGEEPCANCQRRLIRCRFTDNPNNVIVTKQYLQGLKDRAAGRSTSSPRDEHDQAQRLSGAGIASVPDGSSAPAISTPSMTTTSQISPQASGLDPQSVQTGSYHEPNSCSFIRQPAHGVTGQAVAHGWGLTIWTNPFGFPSKIIKNPDKNNRQWLWLAPWSTWSFTVRLTLVLMEGLKHDNEDEMTSASATHTVYPLSWTPIPESEPPDLSGLPSLDHAIYLVDTAKFHLSQQYRFFLDDQFMSQIRTFYRGDATAQTTTSRVWLAKFLVVLAFGAAFLSRGTKPGEAPGSRYFVRAMSLLPPASNLWEGAVLGCETLALLALYFYSTDHRESAVLHIGQAVRIAQLEGLHTQLPEAKLGREMVERCRGLWCTLWIMDRHFSASIGLPMSTADCDFSGIVGHPVVATEEDTVLVLQAKLSQLNWEIRQTLYSNRRDKSPIGVFLENTRSILQTLAGHAQEIEQIIAAKFGNSLEAMPKGTRHITLLYHQCVIVATRPLLYSVLKERLDIVGGTKTGPDDFDDFLALTTTLISTGIKSASKTLQILSREETLLATFLPFDLEFAHGAALHIIMAQALFPDEGEGAGNVQQARDVIEEMILRGSEVGKARRMDLARLERLCGEFTRRSEDLGLRRLVLPIPERSASDTRRQSVAPGEQQQQPQPQPQQQQMAAALMEFSPAGTTAVPHQAQSGFENHSFVDDFGISSDAFFMIADQMADMGAGFGMPGAESFMPVPHIME